MNKIIFILISTISLSTALSAQTKAPAAVVAAFKTRFPAATAVKWGKENAHEYEADFTIDTVKYSANFSDKGAWLETERSIQLSDAPQKVQDAFNAAFHKRVLAVAKIETAKGGVKYEIEVIKNTVQKTELFYSEDGILLKK
jgi:hypothetical protein